MILKQKLFLIRIKSIFITQDTLENQLIKDKNIDNDTIY
jgi:hypothetical protein